MKKNLPVSQKERDYSASANILSTTDLKGSITHFNGDFLAISGFDPDELMHQNHNVIRHPDMPPAAFEDLWATVKDGRSWMGIVKNRCKNGDHYWVDAYVTPIHKEGKTAEYQSVRRKPVRTYVERAETLYQKLMAGKSTPELKPAILGITAKVLLGLWGGLALGFGSAILLMDVPLGAMIIPVLGAAVLATVAAWMALSPLKVAVAKAHAITNNPIARHIYTGRKDEIGSILLALKSLESETDGVVGRIADDAEKLSASASDLSAVVDRSNAGIEHQYAETDQVATAISQMSSTIHEVASNAQLTADSVDEAMVEANKGRSVVTATASAIGALSKEIDAASEVISRVETNSQDISGIVDVISGIAEQTNLLALNAAIEAARAGEQGRGFAVVADEVRTLAFRTNESTVQIKEMIESLQTGTRKAVDVMHSSCDKAMGSVEQANTAAESIDAITNAVERIKDMSVTIASAVEEQSAVSRNINRSVESIREISQQTMQASKETTEASISMSHLADDLRHLSHEFWNRKS